MTALAPIVSYSNGTLAYGGTGLIGWTINNTDAGTGAVLVVSGLTQNSVIQLTKDGELVATVKVVTASDFGDGEVVLAEHAADYVIWNGTGAAPARAGDLGAQAGQLQTATLGEPEAFEMTDATGVVGTLYSAQDGFFQLDQGTKTVYVAGFSAVLVDSKALALSTLYIDADSAGNFDVIGTPFSGDTLDVAVTAVPTASATDLSDETRVNFTDGSSNIVAYYTTTLDETDRDEGFTGKVVVNNADGTTTTYYVQGIESLAFDTLDSSGAPFSYDLPMPPTSGHPTGSVTIEGTAVSELKINASGNDFTVTVDVTQVVDPDGFGTFVSYTWLLDGIDLGEGRTSTTIPTRVEFPIGPEDAGKILSVKYVYLDAAGNEETVTSQGYLITFGDVTGPDYTTAGDTEHLGYLGDAGDNYAVISEGVSGDYTINAGDGFDVVEIKDPVLLGNRVIESKTEVDTYLVQSRIDGAFVTIGTVARNADNDDVVLTKEQVNQQAAARVTLTAVEALALVNPPANQWSDPVTELVPLTPLTEVEYFSSYDEYYVTIKGSVFSDQIAINANFLVAENTLTPFIGQVFGGGGSDRVAVNLGDLFVGGSAFVLDDEKVSANTYTYVNDGNTNNDPNDDLVLTVAISQPTSMWLLFELPEIFVTVETSSQTPVTVFDSVLTAVDTLEIGGLTLDLGRMAELALHDAALGIDNRIATKADDPRDDWKQAAPTSRAVAEDALRVDESAQTTGKVLIGFDDDFIVDIDGTPTRLIEELRGGSADDVLIGLGGDNRLDGGDGYDTVDYSFAFEAVSVSLFQVGEQFTGVSNDTLVRVENIVGSYESDILGGTGRQNGVDGGAGDDFIDGGRGNDHLFGGDGNDHIMGGVGNDVIEGGSGNDTLSGGIGRDTFVFHHPDGVSWTFMSSDLQGSDVITDFNPYADKILISINGGGIDFATDFAATAVAVDVGTDQTPMAEVINNNFIFVINDETNVGSLMLKVGGESTTQIEVTSFQAGLDLSAFDISSYVNVDVLSY